MHEAYIIVGELWEKGKESKVKKKMNEEKNEIKKG